MTVLTRVAAATPERPESRRPSRLLTAGLVVGPLFTLAYLVEGVLRGHGYSAVRHPVSSLALGSRGWEQTLNFLVAGMLVLVFAVGLRRSLRGAPGAGRGPGAVALPVLVAIWGIGLLGAGVFRTDPVGGYPTAASPVTWHGQLHDLAFSLPGFLALALAMFTAASVFARRRSPRMALYSAFSAVAFVVLFGFATSGFGGADPWVDAAGLWQRLCVTVGWGWLAVLAAQRRTSRR
ncbi:DUF998 domain-containing protein [Cryptosporangium phraense]|uniref:DUF998 domain-containing protein n=1 Tax=Cryptosporangium phraense TaxID=2593070 RepID=A0A545AIF4_9ACTN|nr:DUF998 domain-containing protein [Cryptosporangium phraense]TQS41098.1 DUF998 domain-containing protein [Cryptosporangium phraense]